MRSLRRARPGGRAFTLMETLLAVALLAGFLMAATALLFQVTSLWAAQSDDAMLDRHVDGVERFVRRLFAESGASRVVSPTPEQQENEHALLALTGVSGDLPWVAPLVTRGGNFECRLSREDDGGLWLYWNTAGERVLGAVEPHRMLLSPWVDLAAVYRLERDGREWTEVEPGETTNRTAGVLYALRLEFAHQGRRRGLTLLLPRTEGLP